MKKGKKKPKKYYSLKMSEGKLTIKLMENVKKCS